MSTELKAMKKAILILMSLIGATGMASASNNFSYTATGTPGSPPDGVDQNNNPVNVWSVVDTPSNTGGGSGQYFGTAFGGETLSGWQIWSSPFGTGTGNAGNVVATTTFAGGALTFGQTVSINFEMRAIDPGKEVGVDILNGSGAAITFGIFGGEPGPYPYTGNGYYYSDAGSAFVSAGSMGYQYQSEFNIAFTMTGANTYSAVAGSDIWSGTFNGSLIGMDVFNLGAGDGSDVAFNNLTVAPEPSTWAMLAIGGVALLGRRRIFHQG
jgi:hypothetical protein